MSSNTHQTRPLASSSIHRGADLLISLFEQEKAKATADAQRELYNLESRFKKHQEAAAAAQSKSAAQLEELRRTAHLAQQELAKANVEKAEANMVASQARKDLDDLKSILAHIGISHKGGKTLQFHGKWAAVFAQIADRVAAEAGGLKVPMQPIFTDKTESGIAQGASPNDPQALPNRVASGHHGPIFETTVTLPYKRSASPSPAVSQTKTRPPDGDSDSLMG